MSRSILFVLTSHDQLGDTGEPTGFWLEEFAGPYYVLKDAGFDIELASPKGGKPPLDPKSKDESALTEATRRFADDPQAQQQLANTTPLADIDPSAHAAVFYPGGHGPLWDLVSNEDSIGVIESMWKADKPVAAVCHAPAVLLNAKDASGEPIVAGREVTGFSNTEEEAVGLTEAVPFLLQDELQARGGRYARGRDWEAYAVQDGQLITGQNPGSSERAAHLLRGALGIETA